MIRFARFSSLASFASLAVACIVGCSSAPSGANAEGSGATAVEEATNGSGGATSFCSTYCAKLSGCDSTVDLQTCTVQCEDEIGDALDRSNPSITESTTTCVQNADCATALGTGFVEACSNAAIAEAAPTATAESFCNSLKNAQKSCDFDVDLGDCLNTAKQYSDAILTQAASCTSKSCGSISACTDAVFGVVDGADGGS